MGGGAIGLIKGKQNHGCYLQDVKEDHGHGPDQGKWEEPTPSKEYKITPLIHLLTQLYTIHENVSLKMVYLQKTLALVFFFGCCFLFFLSVYFK